MDTNIEKLLSAKNNMMIDGLLIEAAEKYFAPTVRTIDFDGTVTIGKPDTMHKMNHFFQSIQNNKSQNNED